MSLYKLTDEIIKLSNSSLWDIAKLEWELIDIRNEDNSQECLCGHYPIKEVCTIQNKITNETAELGNCCVKKFDTGMHKIIPSIKKVINKDNLSVNSETIDFAFKKEIINAWERSFYIDILRKKNLSDNQLTKKISINKKLLKIIKFKNNN